MTRQISDTRKKGKELPDRNKSTQTEFRQNILPRIESNIDESVTVKQNNNKLWVDDNERLRSSYSTRQGCFQS